MTHELFLAGEEDQVSSLTAWSQVTLEAAHLSPQAGGVREAGRPLFLRKDRGDHLESTTGWLWRGFSRFLTNRSASRTVSPTEQLCLPTFKSSHTLNRNGGLQWKHGEILLMTGGQKMHKGGSVTACLQTPHFFDLHSSYQHFVIHKRKYLPRNAVRKEAANIYQQEGAREQQPNLKRLYGFRRTVFLSLVKKHISFLNTQYVNGTADD